MHEVVVLTQDKSRWPAGTSGTVVDHLSEGLVMVELVGPDGATLALLELPVAALAPAERHREGAAMTPQAGLDRPSVALRVDPVRFPEPRREPDRIPEPAPTPASAPAPAPEPGAAAEPV